MFQVFQSLHQLVTDSIYQYAKSYYRHNVDEQLPVATKPAFLFCHNFCNYTLTVILIRMQSLMILGRLPALGTAELESLYGADKVKLVGTQAVIVDVDPCLLAFDRLGGSVKFCKV